MSGRVLGGYAAERVCDHVRSIEFLTKRAVAFMVVIDPETDEPQVIMPAGGLEAVRALAKSIEWETLGE